jgi:hypothetical protein
VRELVELRRRQIREDRKCCNPTRIHARGSCHRCDGESMWERSDTVSAMNDAATTPEVIIPANEAS